MSYPKNRKSKYNLEFKNKCRELYSFGLSTTEVAKIMRCFGTYISRWNREKGINRTVSEGLKLKGHLPPSQKGKKRSIETKLKISGSNNHFWKGGVTPLAKCLRMSQKMIDWRKKVFKRDNYTCQICKNSKGKLLNAHHLLITVKYMVNKFKTLKECFDYKPFWKLSNGITLHEKCHKEVHHYQEDINDQKKHRPINIVINEPHFSDGKRIDELFEKHCHTRCRF